MAARDLTMTSVEGVEEDVVMRPMMRYTISYDHEVAYRTILPMLTQCSKPETPDFESKIPRFSIYLLRNPRFCVWTVFITVHNLSPFYELIETIKLYVVIDEGLPWLHVI